MGAIWGTEMGYGRISHEGDSRFKNHPDYVEDDDESLYKYLLQGAKHSDSELQYFAYRAGVGMMLGAMVGCSVLTTVVRKQPYMTRKIGNQIKSSEFIPFNEFRLVITGTLWPYIIGGGFVGFNTSLAERVFSRTFDCNSMTKYMFLGTSLGGFYMMVFGRTGMVWLGCLGGLIAGTVYGGGRTNSWLQHIGDFGQNHEDYFSNISDDEKLKHKMQEMRLMGYSGNQLLKKS